MVSKGRSIMVSKGRDIMVSKGGQHHGIHNHGLVVTDRSQQTAAVRVCFPTALSDGASPVP